MLVAEQADGPFLTGERVESRTHAEVDRLMVTESKWPDGGPVLTIN